MNHNLAQVLIDKGVLKVETEVDALYTTVDIDGITHHKASGTFMIRKAYKTESGNVNFELASIVDGRNVKVSAEDILKVDGMVPNRLALVYNIKGDGSRQNVGKKRGRKPKIRTVEEIAKRNKIVKRKGPRIRKVKP